MDTKGRQGRASVVDIFGGDVFARLCKECQYCWSSPDLRPDHIQQIFRMCTDLDLDLDMASVVRKVCKEAPTILASATSFVESQFVRTIDALRRHVTGNYPMGSGLNDCLGVVLALTSADAAWEELAKTAADCQEVQDNLQWQPAGREVSVECCSVNPEGRKVSFLVCVSCRSYAAVCFLFLFSPVSVVMIVSRSCSPRSGVPS